ncbi:MAG: GPW/gp25 family protein [Oscillospiraceae bacterium]|jgi:phage baseplate assembly protein W|nr:GPW/gp25 family protein [Oscillospiraceae bacterium]
MDQKSFLGKGWKFPLQTDPNTGRIAMASHENDIAEAIGIIIGTHRGERVMRPDYGSTVRDYIFEADSDTLRESLAYELSRQLSLQEPRIRDVSVECDAASTARGALIFEVSYTVRSTNNRYNKVYPFYTEEGDGGN